jgi:hypothetical protein
MMPQDNRDDRKDETEKLRADAAAMLERARNQLADIQRALSSLGDDRAAHGRLAAEADRLSAIVSQLTQAVNAQTFPLRGADLVAIGSAVQSGEAHAALTEAAAPAATSSATLAANVATTSAETRSETESLARDVFDQHIFDRYLHYSSAADEEESRKRQAEDKKYIAAQLARHTPEGDLNASGGLIDSMLDLHAHGAGSSPAFMPDWNALAEKADRQHAAMRAAGQSTAEYDHRVDAAARRYLKNEEHLSDAEIDNRLSGGVNPLDVVKSYLTQDPQSHGLNRQSIPASVEPAKPAVLPHVETDPSAGAAMPEAPLAMNVGAMGAKLKAAGVKLNDTTEAAPAHGVTVAKPSIALGASPAN